MGNKAKEKDCLDKIINNQCIKGEISREIHNLILSIYNQMDSNPERPDFVFLSDNTVLGLEHCLMDSLYNAYKESFSRQ